MQCENEKLNNNKARKENCPCHFSNISSVFSQAFSYFIQRSLQFEALRSVLRSWFKKTQARDKPGTIHIELRVTMQLNIAFLSKILGL
jgi:hypothetical protein